jgi:hypothetical protein
VDLVNGCHQAGLSRVNKATVAPNCPNATAVARPTPPLARPQQHGCTSYSAGDSSKVPHRPLPCWVADQLVQCRHDLP